MAARAASSLLLLLLLLPCLLQLASISCLASPTGGRRGLLAYVPARKRAGIGGGRGADCRAMTSRKACLGRSEWCRWCRSDALDDMCFGSAEAWRLPRQIFSCEAPDA
ncbi:hypothetical protein C4D60_Mb04t00940 [Musa balbisiana]|uniref:Uncharacterized protein n=1 Tax=Musa balbisiana TaxID=52838 RepID=A0A4V4H9F1_MUSBA|nr:hypothetical protein C4D60_Mb04t00940 [Musa balbisiana]